MVVRMSFVDINPSFGVFYERILQECTRQLQQKIK